MFENYVLQIINILVQLLVLFIAIVYKIKNPLVAKGILILLVI